MSGREGKEGAVEDDVVEADVGMEVVAVGAVAAAAVGVMVELPAGGADNTVPDGAEQTLAMKFSIMKTPQDKYSTAASHLPPAAAPALSHGLGGETDAMELRREGNSHQPRI